MGPQEGHTMADIAMTVNGKARKAHVEPRCCSSISCANSFASPAPTSAAIRASAAPARSSLDGRSAKSCTRLRRAGRRLRDHDHRGPGEGRRAAPAAGGFWEEHGLQCGYCTPGMIMSAVDLLTDNPKPSRARDPRRHLRKLLPLHRLPAHRQRHPARREARGRAMAAIAGVCRSSSASASSGAKIRA